MLEVFGDLQVGDEGLAIAQESLASMPPTEIAALDDTIQCDAAALIEYLLNEETTVIAVDAELNVRCQMSNAASLLTEGAGLSILDGRLTHEDAGVGSQRRSFPACPVQSCCRERGELAAIASGGARTVRADLRPQRDRMRRDSRSLGGHRTQAPRRDAQENLLLASVGTDAAREHRDVSERPGSARSIKASIPHPRARYRR